MKQPILTDEVKEQIERVAKAVREAIEQIGQDWEILQLLVHPRSERVITTQKELAKHYEGRMRAKLAMFYKQGRWNGERPIVVELPKEEE